MEQEAVVHRDTMIAELVTQLRSDLVQVPERAESLMEQALKGVTPGEARGVTKDEFNALYKIARELCDSGNFADALPIGLQLVLNDARDARYAFLAGSCLQRMDMPKEAGSLFGVAITMDPGHVAAMYRLGECLQAVGSNAEAAQILEACIEASRGDDAHRAVHDLALARLAALRKIA